MKSHMVEYKVFHFTYYPVIVKTVGFVSLPCLPRDDLQRME